MRIHISVAGLRKEEVNSARKTGAPPRSTPGKATKTAAAVRETEKRKSVAADENEELRPGAAAGASRKTGSKPETAHERLKGPYVHIEGDLRSPRLVQVVNSGAHMPDKSRYLPTVGRIKQ